MAELQKPQVYSQPLSAKDYFLGEKALERSGLQLQQHDVIDQCQCHRDERPDHDTCHSSRLRRTAGVTFLSLLTLFTAVALVCAAAECGILSDWGWDVGTGELVSRAIGSNTGTNTGSGPFVNRKLYLIVVFVGLLLVLIFGILLSAWCCRGSFQNPLCCPCYLCACCGGLACLECIGCGLCAEGLENA